MRWSKQAKEVLTKFAKTPRSDSKGGIIVPSNKTVKAQVAKLTKTVAALKKTSVEQVTTFSQYAANENLTANYNVHNLSRIYNYCNPIFGSNAADLQDVGKAYLNSKDIYVSIQQSSEPNLVKMTMYLCSLKDQGATTTLFDPASRQLVLSSGGVNYAQGADATQAVLNPKAFTVHAVRRFTMGYEGAAGPAADTYSQRRFKFTIKPKQKMIENATGNVFNNSDFSSPIDPSQNYFLIVFNDNSLVDLEYPKITIAAYDHWAIAS